MQRRAILFIVILLGLASLSYAQAPVPLINLPLVPDATPPGGPQFTLTVNGTGFVSNSVVNWNGTPLATQFVSQGQLTATVPAADIAKVGTSQIIVVNPSPGGGISTAVPFEVTNPLSALTLNRSDYAPPNMYASVVVGDFNGDGNLDFAGVTFNNPKVSVYLGDGHGAFVHRGEYPTGGNGNNNDELAVGDFNGDGIADLAVRGGAVLLGNGDGSFQAPLVFPGGENSSVAVGDFNGDGKLDLASTNESGIVYILLGNGDGTFQNPVSYPTGPGGYGIAVGDFNQDGKLDLAVALSEGDGVAVLLGNGDGTFQQPVEYATNSQPSDLYTADLNGDGVLDLVVPGNSSAKVSVLLGNGDGTFRPHVDYPTGSVVRRGGIADVNGDGKLDLVLTTWANSDNVFFILPGNGDGTFGKGYPFTAGTCPLGTAFGDFNKDGILDMVIGDQCASMSVMLGAVVGLQPDTLNFGTVGVGQQASLTSQLTNIRKSTLDIESITISHGNGTFSQTNNCGSSLGAGQSCTVTVTFAPLEAGNFAAGVVVKDKAPGSPQAVFLSGAGEALARRK